MVKAGGNRVEKYNPIEHEFLALQVWALMQGRDLASFAPAHQGCEAFLAQLRAGEVWFVRDSKSIWCLVTFQPIFGAHLLGGWVREDMRKTAVSRMILDSLLIKYKVLYMITELPYLIREGKKHGFKLCGRLPGLYGPNRPGLVAVREG